MSEGLLTSKEHSNFAICRQPQQTRRRRAPESETLFPSPPRTRSTPDRPAKRRKTRYTEEQVKIPEKSTPFHTAGLWDSLSRIPLTKSALEELNRRNRRISQRVRRGEPVFSHIGLLRYARHGGPDLCDLRDFKDMPPAQQKRSTRGGITKARGRAGSKSSSRTTSKRTKSSSPYDAVFKQHLIDNRVWPIGHWLSVGTRPPAPDNLQEILGILHESGRNSLQPRTFTVDHFIELQQAYDVATNEEARSRTLDAIEGAVGRDLGYMKQGPVKATNLAPLTPYNLTPGNPDRTFGARPELLHQTVRCGLGHLILPTAAKNLLCPNFVVHIKGPNGSPEVANVQAVYDGALAARGMEALWAYGSRAEQDKDEDQGSYTARTITCTFVAGILRMFAVHLYHGRGPVKLLQEQTPIRLEDVEYSTTLLGTWPIYDDFDNFCTGAAAFRNGLEWARKQVDAAILRANRRANADILTQSIRQRPGRSGY